MWRPGITKNVAIDAFLSQSKASYVRELLLRSFLSSDHFGMSCYSFKQSWLYDGLLLRIADQPVEAGELGAEEGDRELEEPAGGRREGQRHRTDPAARERSEF